MILSASRRTDIPAFYSDWFFERLNAGEFFVPNPFIESGKTARIKIEPVRIERNLLGVAEIFGNLEGIVFWTKNPQPMLARLSELKVPYYFQYTLNPYGKEYESNLPHLEDRIQTFIELSKLCPVVWRYDPIFLSKSITPEWHLEQFEYIAQKLQGSTNRCTINTLIGKYKDAYCPNTSTVREIAEGFVKIGKKYGIEIQACAEIIDLNESGVARGKCIDSEIFLKYYNKKTKPKKKMHLATRKGCNCISSIDIGTYSTCRHGCGYCYADKGTLRSMHDLPDCEIYDRKTELMFEYD